MFFGTQWVVMGRLQDMRDECHEKGEHEKCELLDKVLNAPRKRRRMLLRGVVTEIERRAITVDFYAQGQDDKSAKGIMDLFTWLLANGPAIFALITKLLALFSEDTEEETVS